MLNDLYEILKESLKKLLASRTFILGVFFVFLFGVLAVQLFKLQIIEGEEYQENYMAKTEKTIKLAGTRGNIYDRNQVELAREGVASSVGLVPGKLPEDRDGAIAQLSELLARHLGDGTVSSEAMDAFYGRMAEFSKLCDMLDQSEHALDKYTEDISSLQEKQNNCSEMIEKQQRTQWELEKKLEHLGTCRTRAAALKRVLAENDRVREEILAIEMAQETMTELSSSIRDSFGLYLNKEASRLVSGITGGIYDSMSIDENLNVFLNTKSRLVPLESISSGAMDQVYLALRLAAARLLQGDGEPFPLIFDDSFTLYDDDRLRTALKWLSAAYDGQMIIFTCHRREAQMLRALQAEFQLEEI